MNKMYWKIAALSGVVIVLTSVIGFYVVDGFEGLQKQFGSFGGEEVSMEDDQQLGADPLLMSEDELKSMGNKLTRSLLNGGPVGYDRVRKKVVGVMIENSLSARTHHQGLSKADIVYETLVEGGITRFLAFFQGNDVGEIGPVRSVRPYFLDWIAEYDAVIIHAGGSTPAVNALATGEYAYLRDLDAGYFDKAFWRDKDLLKVVTWEHVLFTSLKNLEEIIEKRNWGKWKTPEIWLFADKDEELYETSEGANEVVVNFSRPSFNVKYRYDEESDSYLRFMLGKPHMDNLVDEQIAPKNVVLLYTSIGLRAGENPLGWISVRTTGSGKAELYVQGRKVVGKWKKKTKKGRLILTDENDEEMVFASGQIWLHWLPN